MHDLLQKKWFAAMLPALLMAMAAAVTAQLVLQNLFVFLSFDPQFSAIFAQIQEADMSTPVLMLSVISFLFCLPMIKKCRNKTIMAVSSFVFWVLLTVLAVLLTTVNGILFWDVLISLLELMRKGGI